MIKRTIVIVLLTLLFNLPLPLKAGQTTLRVGYFPNITHAQAVVGMYSGAFQKEMGSEVKIDAKVFNAGPSVIEAIFAGELDLAYVGPNPAINGYIKSNTEALRIIAGATSGGAALVVRKGAGISSIKDFHQKKIASPQLGNTQDVSLRVWLKRNGMVLSDKGGDVQVIPVKNSDQLTLFLNKQIDGAWTVEPWVSRLVNEGGGEVFLEESSLWPDGEYVTACVIANKKFLYAHPDLVKKWLNVHVKLTLWINAHPAEAKIIMNKGLKNLTRAVLSESVLDSSFARLKITYDPIKSSLSTFAQSAFEQGFLGKNKPELTGIYDLKILNEILKERGLKTLD